ncbi:hypothetical protein D3C75_331500 [compost metagenome]
MQLQHALGYVSISKEAVLKIIGTTAAATGGIAAMSTGVLESIARKLGGTSQQGGIELKEEVQGLQVKLNVVVHYGVRMQEVCQELQYNVLNAVESLTGLGIASVTVHVTGVAVART